jgi:3'-phosphoadenosine 5'-phosphosulfate sulfotransferase (PAPS reductase)/FAD synthetase
MTDPFLIEGPAIISVSGGRTSGYMLHRILQAHCGTLPADVHAVFANTGREMPATLDFVRDMEAEWNVRINWLEYRRDPTAPAASFDVVSHNSASREGEPFVQMLPAKQMLPNPVMRFCTQELKIRTIKRWVVATFGWTRWLSVVGLRADEMHRVERTKAGSKERWRVVTPLADAGATVLDVARFWAAQPFDLGLAGKWEGNCDGCFLKSRAAILRMHADHPQRMKWWAHLEATKAGKTRDPSVARFRKDREPYAELAQLVRDMPRLPFDETMIEGGEPCDMGCGA